MCIARMVEIEKRKAKMTHDEFNNTSFGYGMKAKYKEHTYEISAVAFDEMLIELDGDMWARCENVELEEKIASEEGK